MDLKTIDKIVIAVGFQGIVDYLLNLALPILGASLFLAIILPLIIPSLITLSIMLIIATILFLVAYPFAKYSSMKQNINENLHFFITYAGTISTMKISRYMLFKRIAQKTVFGEISNVFEKVLYLSKSWNMGFAKSCRVMSKRTPSQILADFLDRFAVIMDFGEDLDIFLGDEQSAVLDDYSVEYKKSLEVIKMIQELFMALSVAFAFLVSTLLLAPLLIDIPVEGVMLVSLMGLIMMDAGIIVAIRNFIPSDALFHNLPDKNEYQKKIRKTFFITLSITMLSLILLIIFTKLSFVIILALSLSPLVIPGMMAAKEEETVKRRDVQFPIFARVFGSAIEVRNGGVMSALKATQNHDFTVLNDMNISMYRRLRIGSDKFKSWYLYAVDSGSNIISNFSKIFSESIYIGGNAEKIGEIISKNVQHLIALRKLRWQLSQGLIGVFYGIMIGISLTIFITFRIAQKMFELFSTEGLDSEIIQSFSSTIMPMSYDINFDILLTYIVIMLVIHAFTSSWIIKIVDGGSFYTLMINLVLMMWIVALLYWLMPPLVDLVLPDMTNVWGLEVAETLAP